MGGKFVGIRDKVNELPVLNIGPNVFGGGAILGNRQAVIARRLTKPFLTSHVKDTGSGKRG
jgi:hypothetical protein